MLNALMIQLRAEIDIIWIMIVILNIIVTANLIEFVIATLIEIVISTLFRIVIATLIKMVIVTLI